MDCSSAMAMFIRVVRKIRGKVEASALGRAVERGMQGVAQGRALCVIQCGVAGTGDEEQVFRALAEGRDARVLHAHALAAQHVRHIGEQAGTIGADQAQSRMPRVGRAFQADPRRDAEVLEMTRLTDDMRHFQFVAQMAEREGERLGSAVERILRRR